MMPSGIHSKKEGRKGRAKFDERKIHAWPTPVSLPARGA
jgi:hypothetical protein